MRNGPARLLTELKAHRLRFTDLRRLVPRRYWRELQLDDDFDHRFDKWVRYLPEDKELLGSDRNGDGRPDVWEPREPAPVAAGEPAPTAPPAGKPAAPRTGDDKRSHLSAGQPEETPASSRGRDDRRKNEDNTPPRVRVKARVLEE